MRPASEIHSALQLLEHELQRVDEALEARIKLQSGPDEEFSSLVEMLDNITIARDVLWWVVGGTAPMDDRTNWLVAFLLDDPDKIDDTPPEMN